MTLAIDKTEKLKDFISDTLSKMFDIEPETLTEYIIALLKDEVSVHDLKNNCRDQLRDFLNDGTYNFVSRLFKYIQENDILTQKDHSPVHRENEFGHSNHSKGPRGQYHERREHPNSSSNYNSYNQGRPNGPPLCRYFSKYGNCSNPNCHFFHPSPPSGPSHYPHASNPYHNDYNPFEPTFQNHPYPPTSYSRGYNKPPRGASSFRNVFIPPSFTSNTYIPQNSQIAKTTKEPCKTLHITKIPMDSLSEQKIRDYFETFGTLESVQLHQEFRQAKVTFEDVVDATKAHDAPGHALNSLSTVVEYDNIDNPIPFQYISDQASNGAGNSEIEKKNQALLSRLTLKRSKQELLDKLIENKKIITEALESPETNEETKQEYNDLLKDVESRIADIEEYMAKVFPPKTSQTQQVTTVESVETKYDISTSATDQNDLNDGDNNGISHNEPQDEIKTKIDTSKLTSDEIQDLYTLDKRPAKFILYGFSEEEKPIIEEYFTNASSFIDIQFDFDEEGGAYLNFTSRTAAERAILAFSNDKVGKLQGKWIVEAESETEPLSEETSNLKRDIDQVDDYVPDDVNPEKLAKSEV